MSRMYALITGSGFDALPGSGEEHALGTRFGDPSAPIRMVRLGAHQVFSLARHGASHTIPPHAINYRANLVALKELGADVVIALNTVGVISEVCAPGTIAVPDQVIDYTWGREHTIYDGSDGIVRHIEFTEPLSPRLRAGLLDAARAAGIACHDGGVYAATQGPRLESAAEVDRLDRDGNDFVGMTAMPEAAIAAELGLEYAVIAMVVNRAAGRGDVPIFDDVEAGTVGSRDAALKLLQQFFKAAS